MGPSPHDLELAAVPQKSGENKTNKSTMFTATTHIITAMIGAGVLAMPNAFAQLGWVAGPVCLLLFYFIQLAFAQLLASVFEVDGKQHPRYFEAVAHVLGRRAELACAWIQGINIVLVCIAYTLTASISMQVIANMTCDLPSETDINSNTRTDGCFNASWVMTVIFGASQILFSQLPNIEESWVLSVVGAGTAIFYSAVALVLCIIKVAQGNAGGTVGGLPDTPASKAFNVLNALGTMGFAFSFSQILLEIQDTLREPPKAAVNMKKSIKAGLAVGVSFYMSVAVFGFLAFGDTVMGDIYSEFNSPKGLLMVCNVLIALHMVAAYNVFAQALFLTLEEKVGGWLGLRDVTDTAALHAAEAAAAAAGEEQAPPPGKLQDEGVDGLERTQSEWDRVHAELISQVSYTEPDGMERVGSIAGPYRVDAPVRHWREHPLAGRLVSIGVRTIYVIFTTIIAVVCPFFSQITGLVGSIAFWPLAVYFPLAMYEKVYKPVGHSRTLLRIAAGFMLLVAAGATVASVRNIIVKWQTFTFI